MLCTEHRTNVKNYPSITENWESYMLDITKCLKRGGPGIIITRACKKSSQNLN